MLLLLLGSGGGLGGRSRSGGGGGGVVDVQVLDVRSLKQDVIVHGVIGGVGLPACGSAAFGAEALDGLQGDAGLLLVDGDEDAFVPDILVGNEADVRADALARSRHLTRRRSLGGVLQVRKEGRKGVVVEVRWLALLLLLLASVRKEHARAPVCGGGGGGIGKVREWVRVGNRRSACALLGGVSNEKRSRRKKEEGLERRLAWLFAH